NAFQALAIDEHRKPFQPSVWQQSPQADGQKLEQVWFAGVHSNVGGSYPNSGLSDITLLWMLRKAESSGLEVNREKFSTINRPQPDPLGTLYNSQTVWYKVTGLGDYVRPMGQGANECAASTALERVTQSGKDYDPSNLKDFMAAGGNSVPIPTSPG